MKITMSGPACFRVAFDYQRHKLAHGLAFGAMGDRMGLNFYLMHRSRFPEWRGGGVSTFRGIEATFGPVFNGSIGSSSFDGRTAITSLPHPDSQHRSYVHSRRHPLGLPS